MDWRPASIDEVRQIVEKDLAACGAEQRATFAKYAVEPRAVPITRNGKNETVVVIARKNNEVMYYEDVEEGFNVSPVTEDGRIAEHWCNQDELGFALNCVAIK